MLKKLKNYGNLLAGLFLAALSFNIFLAPNNLAAGGVSGLALIINKLFSINESLFIMVTNLILLLISFIFLGKEKTKNTIVGSILFPAFINLTSAITLLIHINEIEILVIAILGGTLSGIGYGLVFKSGFTSGGTDILNQIIEKYFHIPISTSIILIDGLITCFSGLVFGIQTMLYALLALILISIFSNKIIIGLGKSKSFYIYSKKQEEIKAYLHEELKIDSTDFNTIGGLKKEPGKVILTVIETKDYYRIKEAINTIDPDAFIIATDTYGYTNANVTIRNK